MKIEAFYSKENSNWVLLPETSEYLTKLQLVPNAGDVLTIAGQDGEIIGLEPGSFEHIMSVKRRWFNYASSDVAILLHYVAF